MDRVNVLIVGGGPSGLAFAARLKQRGVERVSVFERDPQAGGVPRHCGHWGFGWESHRSFMNGPAYAAKLGAEASSVDVRVSHTVLKALDSNTALAQSPDRGFFEIRFNHIVFACGARETTRAAHLIGGVRNASVMNTGTLQQLVYLKRMKPFQHPVILGGEWLSFSALMTCKHAGIKPSAMLVRNRKFDAPGFFALGAKLRYGVPVLRDTELLSIEGSDNVSSVRVSQRGKEATLLCDGVIVSGKLVPEDTVMLTYLQPTAHCLGNMRGDIKTAGRCVAEARTLADVFAEQIR